MILENYVGLVLRNIDNACREMSHQLEREIVIGEVIQFEIPISIRDSCVSVKSDENWKSKGATLEMSLYIGRKNVETI